MKPVKRYIVFEGCDYTGKTTYAKALVNTLNFFTPGCAVYTKEPGSPLSETCIKIRELIINSKDIKNPETYSYLFAADTFEHMYSYVTDLLSQGVIVVSDRSVVSDFAYRPEVNIGLRQSNLNKFKSLRPLVIWCRSNECIIQERYNKRQDSNEFERIHVMDKLEKINNAYNDFFLKNKDIDMFPWFSTNDDHHDQETLFNRIVKYNA